MIRTFSCLLPLLLGGLAAVASAEQALDSERVHYADGGRYSGQLQADQRHGRGYYRYPGGDQYLGQWADDEKQGQGGYLWTSGNYYQGGWANGLQQGDGAVIHADGALIAGRWEAGELVAVHRTEGPTPALRARLERAETEMAAAAEVFPPKCEPASDLWIKPEKEMIWNDQVNNLTITVTGPGCQYRERIDARDGFFNEGFVRFSGLGNGSYEIVIKGAGARKGPFRISRKIRHPGATEVVCGVDLVEEFVQCRHWGPHDRAAGGGLQPQ